VAGSMTRSPRIYLKKPPTSLEDFARIHAGELDTLGADEKLSGKYKHVLVRQSYTIPPLESREMNHTKLFQFRSESTVKVGGL
jgi:hypothetical protein